MTSTATPGPSSASSLRPRLTRSRTQKKIAGVAGGLAEYTGVDAVIWRVAFLALTICGGSGILVYALLWLLLPADEDQRS
jgi:phage shock protein PspC (stress-responsive transcriptional regulator)